MNKTPHLLVALSAHGYGHLAQVAPVVNALRARRPGLRLTLRTALPQALLSRRIEGPFDHQAVADDIGMVQTSALDLDLNASASAYRHLHADWNTRVAAVAAALADARAHAVLANVSYLTLAAATLAGIPAVALCSLHWEAIYGHYFAALPEAAALRAQMRAAYAGARVFLRPEPSMPMPGMANARDIGPVAMVGCRRREELIARAGAGPDHRLVLVAPGGIPTRLPVESWPRFAGVRFIFPGDWQVARADAVALEALDMPFSDVLASCDLLITKPGYGSFTEAAVNGIPVLYVPRGDWPEEPALAEWLGRCGSARAVSRDAMAAGRFADELAALLDGPRPSPVAPSGTAQAAGILSALLDVSCGVVPAESKG